MSVALYMDVHVHGAITEQLELRGVDVITAQDDSRAEEEDDELLRRASELGRAIFTQDEDFLVIAAEWRRSSIEFAGVVYGHQLHVPIGKCVEDLELIAKCYEPIDLMNRVEYLPLQNRNQESLKCPTPPPDSTTPCGPVSSVKKPGPTTRRFPSTACSN